MTVHIESFKEDIAEIVLMPGDPLRAKYIADNFLTDCKLVNRVRNMYGYTGYYKNKRITVFASGMGIPSIGIYAYELYKFYDVKKIIRIGTSGSFNKDIKINDVVLSLGAHSKTYFPLLFANETIDFVSSSNTLNELIKTSALHLNIDLKIGKTITSDVFDLYCNSKEEFQQNFTNDTYLATEMEAFGLFYIASKLQREAACIMTVVDSFYDTNSLTSEEREKSLDRMITLALDAAVL